jgi:acid phosphatase class B
MSNAEEFTYVLPEDYVLQDKHRKKLDKLVNETRMNNPHAQQFIDLHVEITDETVNLVVKAMTKLTIATGALSCLITAAVILTIVAFL